MSRQGEAGAQGAVVSWSGLGAALVQPAMLALISLAALVYIFSVGRALRGRARDWDFCVYYASAVAAREHLDPYTTDIATLGARFGLQAGRIDRATDPPTFILLFEPFTLLKPAAAYWLWIALNALAFVAALFVLLGPASGLSARAAIVLAALAIFYPPVGDHFYYSQSKIPVLLMMAAMMRWMERGHERAAGLVLALAGLLRAFPLALLGYVVVRRRWAAFRWTFIGLAAGGASTMSLFGVANSLSFLRAVGFLTGNHWLDLSANIALDSFVSRIFRFSFGPHPATAVAVARTIVVTLAMLALVGSTVEATVRRRAGRDPDSAAFCLWVVTSVMLSPTAWIHYMVLVLVPFAQLAVAANFGRASRRALWAAVASYALIAAVCTGCPAEPGAPLLVPILPDLRTGGVFILGQIPFMAVFAAWLSARWFVVDEVRDAPARACCLGAA